MAASKVQLRAENEQSLHPKKQKQIDVSTFLTFNSTERKENTKKKNDTRNKNQKSPEVMENFDEPAADSGSCYTNSSLRAAPVSKKKTKAVSFNAPYTTIRNLKKTKLTKLASYVGIPACLGWP